MKLAIISDLHSADPMPVVERLTKEGIEGFRFLGDYDEPRILKNLLELKANKIVLVGNHDYSWATGNSDLGSPMLERHPWDYVDMWKDEPELLRYVQDEIKRKFSRTEKLGKLKVAYCHASLVREKTSWLTSEVWERFADDHYNRRRQIYLNFAKMRRRNINIFFRGHDHSFQVWRLTDQQKLINIPITYKELKDFGIHPGFRYIVTVGCFKNGEYCVFDSKNKKVEFKSWK